MISYRLTTLMLSSLLGLAACGGGDQTSSPSDPINEDITYAVFSPATRQFPIPNDILFAPQTVDENDSAAEIDAKAADGTMFASFDPSNPVFTGIDALDGNSVLSPMDIAFTDSLDDSQTFDAASFIVSGNNIIPNPNQNVFLLPLVYPSSDSLNTTGVEIPTFAEALAYQTAIATLPLDPTGAAAALGELAVPTARAEIISLDGGTDNVLRINPLRPLKPKTKYLIVVTGAQDSQGNAVQASTAYQFLKDPDSDLDAFGNPALLSIRQAIIGWEQLAAGYFDFMQTVFDGAGVPATAPGVSDIIISLTFTTGGTTDVLNYLAAPESFFEESLRIGHKQDAIQKLVNGQYLLSGETTLDPATATDTAIAMTLNALLTSQTIPGTMTPNPLFSESIAQAINAGAPYATIAGGSATAAHIMQRAAAEASISVNDAGGGAIAATALETVQGILAAVPLEDVFPIPAARVTNFFRRDAAASINQALQAPAQIIQGEITLPYYQKVPTSENLGLVQSSTWVADQTIGGVIDTVRENEPGTTPPSSKITYRYPFPAKQTDVTVPILVTTPDEATLGALGMSKPAEGWPTIIYLHGITTDRSAVLPMANALAFACVAVNAEGMPTGPSGLPCYATVAIDQPLHGVAPDGSTVPGLTSVSAPNFDIMANVGDNMPSDTLAERHFNVTAGANLAPTAMTYDPPFGSSGSLFVNLTNFLNARDNQRQMALDLLNLNASIASMDLDDNPATTDLDSGRVYFVGHSLGGITGLPFVAVNNTATTQSSSLSSQPMVRAASGLTTGGGVVRLLTNSQSFAPTILQGLAAANDSLVQGNSSLESYFNVFQGVLDSADVTNFASSLSDSNSSTGILLAEVIGDVTIPNAADDSLGTGPLSLTLNSGFVIDQFPAPLAATEPLINQFGAVMTATANGDDGDAAVIVTRYTEGSHGTPVSADNLPVFREMVSQIAQFFAVDGNITDSIIVDNTVVEDSP